MVVLTALGEGKLLMVRRVSRAWTSFLGSPRTEDEVGLGSWCREGGQVFQLAVEEEGGIGEVFRREAEGGAEEDLAGQEFESRLDEGLRTLAG